MTRTNQRHPFWCGQGHVCSIGAPAGEHRSDPLTVDTNVGRIVATRIQTRRGINRLELRAVVDLPTDAVNAQLLAGIVMRRLEQALTPAGAR